MGEHILAVLKAAGWGGAAARADDGHTDNTAQWDGMYWSVIRNVGWSYRMLPTSSRSTRTRPVLSLLLRFAAANAAEEAK